MKSFYLIYLTFLGFIASKSPIVVNSNLSAVKIDACSSPSTLSIFYTNATIKLHEEGFSETQNLTWLKTTSNAVQTETSLSLNLSCMPHYYLDLAYCFLHTHTETTSSLTLRVAFLPKTEVTSLIIAESERTHPGYPKVEGFTWSDRSLYLFITTSRSKNITGFNITTSRSIQFLFTIDVSNYTLGFPRPLAMTVANDSIVYAANSRLQDRTSVQLVQIILKPLAISVKQHHLGQTRMLRLHADNSGHLYLFHNAFHHDSKSLWSSKGNIKNVFLNENLDNDNLDYDSFRMASTLVSSNNNFCIIWSHYTSEKTCYFEELDHTTKLLRRVQLKDCGNEMQLIEWNKTIYVWIHEHPHWFDFALKNNSRFVLIGNTTTI